MFGGLRIYSKMKRFVSVRITGEEDIPRALDLKEPMLHNLTDDTLRRKGRPQSKRGDIKRRGEREREMLEETCRTSPCP